MRRDLIAARLLSKGGACELDEDIFDSSDASDQEKNFFSNKENKDKLKKSIPSGVE